ncbi:hypothetical protein Btru_045074 [Bulinus truncatus]|nr:hypothetical protein Btru_045074 [Bulinus truncatus]
MIRRVYVEMVLLCLCMTHEVDAQTTQAPFRAEKARLKSDLRARHEAMGFVSPGDDRTQKQIDMWIYFWPFAVVGVDEVKQTISTFSTFLIVWNDFDLSWNLSSYSNITLVTEKLDRANIVILRSSTYYIFSTVLPFLLISIMTPIVFWIPSSSGERMSYLVSNFLSMTVYLSYLRHDAQKYGQTAQAVIVLDYNNVSVFRSVIIAYEISYEETRVGAVNVGEKCRPRRR